eukprot:CAMPEP_0115871870 /NCGR_PEP_ID=MMETSP0287-20121206/23115_1 /TAXON_ID=412157 /ORGANISM="Chrysochromulina rotalis, Strain UIO044" /LENGTH=70 /DNA_ID=CAMNT_0003326737 /DNA_START=292 /DNA_END=501 /DNA_ORIENTATION=+
MSVQQRTWTVPLASATSRVLGPSVARSASAQRVDGSAAIDGYRQFFPRIFGICDLICEKSKCEMGPISRR